MPNSSCHFQLYFLSSSIIHFGQKQPIKVQLFKIFECLGKKFLKFPMPVLNWLVNSFSNYASFFILITHNSPVNLKLIHFLLWIKGPNKSPNLETFFCSVHFPDHKTVFLQVLHHSLVSWNITSLYFFNSNVIQFGQKQPIKV